MKDYIILEIIRAIIAIAILITVFYLWGGYYGSIFK